VHAAVPDDANRDERVAVSGGVEPEPEVVMRDPVSEDDVAVFVGHQGTRERAGRGGLPLGRPTSPLSGDLPFLGVDGQPENLPERAQTGHGQGGRAAADPSAEAAQPAAEPLRGVRLARRMHEGDPATGRDDGR
jgi:hypothetical protein